LNARFRPWDFTQLDLFEDFTKKIVEPVQNSPYAQDSAIVVSLDEGGGPQPGGRRGCLRNNRNAGIMQA